eukprot:TRINITY_DN13405_c1_g3_i1.p1 TRINITY_DN13405_c1_g3~~TRINITY_DN13405_c1_g3_i1.p1  ORF type:complete len:1090 (+),score=359.28 TRINITY_DN13405_c1_g3_i1:84-3353(+)
MGTARPHTPPPSFLLYPEPEPPSRPSSPGGEEISADWISGEGRSRRAPTPPPPPRRPGGPLYRPYKQQSAALFHNRVRTVGGGEAGRAGSPRRPRPPPLDAGSSPLGSPNRSPSPPHSPGAPGSGHSPRLGHHSPHGEVWVPRLTAAMEEALAGLSGAVAPPAAADGERRLGPARDALRLLILDPAPPRRLRQSLARCLSEFDGAVRALRNAAEEAQQTRRVDAARLAERSQQQLADLRRVHQDAVVHQKSKVLAAEQERDVARCGEEAARQEAAAAAAELKERSADWELHRRRKEIDLEDCQKRLRQAREELSELQLRAEDCEAEARRHERVALQYRREAGEQRERAERAEGERAQLQKTLAQVQERAAADAERHEDELRYARRQLRRGTGGVSRAAVDEALRDAHQQHLEEEEARGAALSGALRALQQAAVWALPQRAPQPAVAGTLAEARERAAAEAERQFPIGDCTPPEAVQRGAAVLREQRQLLERAEQRLREVERRERELQALRYVEPYCEHAGVWLEPLGITTAVPPLLRRGGVAVPLLPLGRAELHSAVRMMLESHAGQYVGPSASPGEFASYFHRWSLRRWQHPEIAQQAAYAICDACARGPSDPIAAQVTALLGRELGGWFSRAVERVIDSLRAAVGRRLSAVRSGSSGPQLRHWATACADEVCTAGTTADQRHRSALAHLLLLAVCPPVESALQAVPLELKGPPAGRSGSDGSVATQRRTSGEPSSEVAPSAPRPPDELLASLFGGPTEDLAIAEVRRYALKRVRRFRRVFEAQLLAHADAAQTVQRSAIENAAAAALTAARDEVQGCAEWTTLVLERWQRDTDRVAAADPDPYVAWWYAPQVAEDLNGSWCIPRALERPPQMPPDEMARKLTREQMLPLVHRSAYPRLAPGWTADEAQSPGLRRKSLSGKVSAMLGPATGQGPPTRRKSAAAALRRTSAIPLNTPLGRRQSTAVQQHQQQRASFCNAPRVTSPTLGPAEPPVSRDGSAHPLSTFCSEPGETPACEPVALPVGNPVTPVLSPAASGITPQAPPRRKSRRLSSVPSAPTPPPAPRYPVVQLVLAARCVPFPHPTLAFPL